MRSRMPFSFALLVAAFMLAASRTQIGVAADPPVAAPAGAAAEAELAQVFSAEPGAKAFVAIDALPVFSNQGLTDIRLKFGTEVALSTTPRTGDFVDIEWMENGVKQTGTVTPFGLSGALLDNKNPIAAPVPVAEADSKNTAKEMKHLAGTWVVAGMIADGKVNPTASDRVLRTTDDFYRIENNKLLRWSVLPEVKDGVPPVWKPYTKYREQTLAVDATTKSRRIDWFDEQTPKTLRKISAGIYEWQAGDVLVWARELERVNALGVGPLGAPPLQIARRGDPPPKRLAGFDAKQTAQANVLYFVRVSPKRFPAPDAPPANPNKVRGGNAF